MHNLEISGDSLRTKHGTKIIAAIAGLTIAALFGFGFSSAVQNASASGVSVLGCTDPSNTNVNGTSVALGTMIKCHTWSTNPHANQVRFYVKDPNGVITLDTGKAAYTTGQVLKFSWTANVAGDWTVHTTYFKGTEEQSICICNMHVSFFVLPESSLGAIGLMGSSLAALGLFVRYNMSKKKTASEASD